MAEATTTRQRPSLLISAVGPEGTIVETLYRPDAEETLFVVSTGNAIGIRREWDVGGANYRPINPRNNLLKHRAVLLPSEPAAFEDTGSLVEEITAYVRRYVSLPESAIALSAAYVLLSWVYDAFNELPYLRFRGDYGTGKTRALLVIGSLCHKAFFASGASTVSPIFHTLDTFKGTLVFDEADFRFSDEKAELVKIFNNGNVSGFPVLRTQVTPAKEFDPRAFAIFGPKLVAMRGSYQDRALESRFLTIEMGPGQVEAAPINLPDGQKDEALALRNKLLSYRLRNRLSTRLDPALVEPAFEPRLNQILLPLLSVAPSAEMRRTVRDYAATLQAGMVAERSETAEGQVLAIVVRAFGEERPMPLSLSEIARVFTEEHGREYERPVTNRWIGSLLRRLGVALYKSNGVFVLVPGQGERLQDLRTRYGIELLKGAHRDLPHEGQGRVARG